MNRGKTIFVLTMAAELDKIDLQILKILQENGRITNLQLSNEIGLSPAPTLERVRKLEHAEYIKSYHALVDEEKLGLGIKTFIQISLDFHQKDTKMLNYFFLLNHKEWIQYS